MIDSNTIQDLQSRLKPLEGLSGRSMWYGAAGGAGLAALISWLAYRKNKKQPTRSKIMKALAWTALGGLAGGIAGRVGGAMYASNKRYQILSQMAKQRPTGETGRVIYANFPQNKWKGKHKVGHSAAVMYNPESGELTVYSVSSMPEYAANIEADSMLRHGIQYDDSFWKYIGSKEKMRAGKMSSPGVAVSRVNIGRNASDGQIAQAISAIGTKWEWGRAVELYEGAKNVDLGVAKRMGNLSLLAARIGEGYSPLPYGYNCGTSAREIFDCVQPRNSAFRRLIEVGSPNINIPSGTNSWSAMISKDDYENKAPTYGFDTIDYMLHPYEER